MPSNFQTVPHLSSTLAVTLLCACVSWNEESIPRSHAHNDYKHPRPLLDALDEGFASVEADVHLIAGDLLVAHDADEVVHGRTLQKLYLDPLRERVQVNRGSIHGPRRPFILLVDIKTEAESTYRVISEVLKAYRDILTSFTSNQTQRGPVTVILSGNRPIETVAQESHRLVGLDGRLPDLARNDLSAHLYPLISDNWKTHFKWRGSGPISPEEVEKLTSLVAQAHQRGCMIRFWANPDTSAYWELALASGVDLINTDKLQELADFLAE
ncbi:MAG: hypothetical protein M2R45_04566 [Verrucomicrobia subdivision 3 bacterium]|nr:hypothetical protein [Limisphaerales bacterium]MCS1416795.1 hypothetical protein [Limisphaerales bacterium]